MTGTCGIIPTRVNSLKVTDSVGGEFLLPTSEALDLVCPELSEQSR